MMTNMQPCGVVDFLFTEQTGKRMVVKYVRRRKKATGRYHQEFLPYFALMAFLTVSKFWSMLKVLKPSLHLWPRHLKCNHNTFSTTTLATCTNTSLTGIVDNFPEMKQNTVLLL